MQLCAAPCYKKLKEWKITFRREIRKISYTCEQDLHATLSRSKHFHVVMALWPSQKILILHSKSKKEYGLEKEAQTILKHYEYMSYKFFSSVRMRSNPIHNGVKESNDLRLLLL